MRHVDLVNAVEALVDATCADSVKDALAAVCAAKADHIQSSYATASDHEDSDAQAWGLLADALNRVENLGV